MSLASQTQTTANYLAEAYNAIEEMGGTLPEHKNLANLAPAIDTIQVTNEGDGTLWGTLYTTSYPNGVAITKADYDKLANSGDGAYSLSIGTVGRANVNGFSFGSACTYTGDYFLYHCTNMTHLDHAETLVEIGKELCSTNNKLNSEIDISNAVTIGNGFLSSCYRLNKPVKLGNHLKKIGMNFLRGCIAFAQPITIPASVTEIDNGFMTAVDAFTGLLTVNTLAHPTDRDTLCGSSSTSPMYNPGVTIAGSGAEAWKAALGDVANSAGFYRHLVLQEGA